jgi:hypothetical protein
MEDRFEKGGEVGGGKVAPVTGQLRLHEGVPVEWKGLESDCGEED